jgi:hypothetical protein
MGFVTLSSSAIVTNCMELETFIEKTCKGEKARIAQTKVCPSTPFCYRDTYLAPR